MIGCEGASPRRPAAPPERHVPHTTGVSRSTQPSSRLRSSAKKSMSGRKRFVLGRNRFMPVLKNR